MDLTARRKKIKSKLLAESSGLQYAINRQNDHIEFLYKQIIEKKISIPKYEKSEIVGIEETIVKNEMESFKITIRFQDQIIEILERLLGMVRASSPSEKITIVDSIDDLLIPVDPIIKKKSRNILSGIPILLSSIPGSLNHALSASRHFLSSNVFTPLFRSINNGFSALWQKKKIIIPLFVAGIIIAGIIAHFMNKGQNIHIPKLPVIPKAQIEKKNPIEQCLPQSMFNKNNDQMVFEINKRLKNATFCCFENREVVIHDNLLNRWKKEYFPFIKCISENIPDGYSLVIVGHANRTGFEEDVTIKKKGGDALLFPGNYSYSTDRAKSLLNEMQILINSSSVVYYGAGSLSPRQDFIFNPSNGANRRITFTLMKTENSIKMKNFFDNQKKKIITK